MLSLGTVAGIEYGVAETEDIGELAHVLGQSFSRHEPPAVALGLSASQIGELVAAFGPKASDERLSVIARSVATQKAIGALLVEDFATPPPDGLDPLVPMVEPVLALLDQLEGAYRKIRSIDAGGYLHLFMIGVLDDWTGRGIAQEMVRMCLTNGATKGYRTAFAETTGTISRHVFGKLGFSELFFINYQEFEFGGKYPFSSIREHEGCTLMEREVAIAS